MLPGKNSKKIVKPGITRFYWIMAFGNYFFNLVINNLGGGAEGAGAGADVAEVQMLIRGAEV